MSKFKVILLLLTTLILHSFLLASAYEIPDDNTINKEKGNIKDKFTSEAESTIKQKAHDYLKEFWDEWGTIIIIVVSVFLFIIICNFCWVIGTCIWCCCRRKEGVAIAGTFATPTEYLGGPTATPSAFREIVYNQKCEKPPPQDANNPNNPALEASPV